MHKVTLIKGDGIGPEISAVCVDVLDALGVAIEWDVQKAGLEAFEDVGVLVPESLLESIERNKVALKGALKTPIGKGFRSVNVALRKHFDLFANIRPIKNISNLETKFDAVDLVIFRENTEDIYAGIETQVSDDEAHSIKVITRFKTERIVKEAFDYAKLHELDKVTVVTKANIMKLSDGLFLAVARDVAKGYPGITLEEILVDNMCMQLVMKPESYRVIVTSNLYGDILSDLAAGLIGGLGLVASGNIGSHCAIFEAVHGSAPDIAGKNLANPVAMLLSCAMMLDYLQEFDCARRLRRAIDNVLADANHRTFDLGGRASTSYLGELLCQEVKRL